MEELSEEYKGKLKIAKVNVDDNPVSPGNLGVRGIPALFLFKDGEMVSNKMGALPKSALKIGYWKIFESFSRSVFRIFPIKYSDPVIIMVTGSPCFY